MPFKDPEKRKAYQKAYRQRPEVKEKTRKYFQRPEVKKKQKEYIKRYYQRPAVKERQKKYYQQPVWKEKKRKYQQKYALQPEVKKRRLHLLKQDPVYKRRKQLREKVYLAVIRQRKYTSTIHKLIGCDVATARAHLESQFEDWMNWKNYGSGRGKWCIDHIVAVATVDIFNEDEVKRIFHYTNMQPLEFCKNCEKGVN